MCILHLLFPPLLAAIGLLLLLIDVGVGLKGEEDDLVGCGLSSIKMVFLLTSCFLCLSLRMSHILITLATTITTRVAATRVMEHT